MIFTEEIVKELNIKNLPTCNDWDCSYLCNGKLTKDFYKVVVDYFSRVQMPIYAIYVPLSRISDHNEWNPVVIQGCSQCGNDLRLDTLTYSEQYDIWIENSKDGYWMPKIIPCKELEGMEYNKIYCHALGVKNIKEYIDKPILSFAEAKEMFPDGLNWVHIKLG